MHEEQPAEVLVLAGRGQEVVDRPLHRVAPERDRLPPRCAAAGPRRREIGCGKVGHPAKLLFAVVKLAGGQPDVPAIVGSEQAWTYAEIDALTAAVAGHLLRLGVPTGATVVVDLAQNATRAALAVAVSSAWVAHSLDPTLAPERRAALLERIAPAAILDGIPTGPPGVPPSVRLDDPAVLLATSGTTGVPKLVVNTHRVLMASAAAVARAQGVGPGDRQLVLGTTAATLGARAVTDGLICGATMLVADDITVDAAAAMLAHRPTIVNASPPALANFLTAVERLGPEVVSELRYVRAGSAALRADLAERTRRLLGVPVIQSYAMSEAAKIACTPLDGSAPPGSVGLPLAAEVRIVDGEIVVRGDSVSPGVLVDGWFHTGDLGRFDDDGFLYVLGRADGVVSRGGIQVSLDVLEDALERHPRVAAALAAPVEHTTLGTDIVLGFVPAGTAPEPAALREFLLTTLPANQVPLRFVRLDSLPLTAATKPSRLALAAQLDAQRASPVGRLEGTELRLAALWRDVLGAEVVVEAADDFFALGGSSLQLLRLCDLIGAEFGVEVLPGQVLGRSELRSMAALLRGGDGRRPALVPLRAGDSERTTLYMVPGAGGSLATLQRFVFGLEHGRRVLGFESPGLYGGERLVRRIDAMARRYVDELLADVEPGSFALMGQSMGGIVAQEMAYQLDERGRPASLLVLGDCPARVRARRMMRLRRTVKSLLDRTRRDDALRPRIQRHRVVMRGAAARHRTHLVTAPTVVFTTEETRTKTSDPLLGWGPFVPADARTVDFPGTHRELIRQRGSATAPILDALLLECDQAVAVRP